MHRARSHGPCALTQPVRRHPLWPDGAWHSGSLAPSRVRSRLAAGFTPIAKIGYNTLSMTLYTSSFCGVSLTTGDVICTTDGEEDSLLGHFWRLMGQLAPGDVDHCIVYLGPGGRCIESGPKGVIVFTMPGEVWDAATLVQERWRSDRYYGVAYPLTDLGLAPDDGRGIRARVAGFCLEQATSRKPHRLSPSSSGKSCGRRAPNACTPPGSWAARQAGLRRCGEAKETGEDRPMRGAVQPWKRVTCLSTGSRGAPSR